MQYYSSKNTVYSVNMDEKTLILFLIPVPTDPVLLPILLMYFSANTKTIGTKVVNGVHPFSFLSGTDRKTIHRDKKDHIKH
jgi:hypothetical protein